MSKITFPSQKREYKRKGDRWRKGHFDWIETFLESDDSPVRMSMANKDKLYRAFIGRLGKSDYESILNPQGLKNMANKTPDNIQHLPIAVPYLSVLVGEEAERRFEWRAIVTNPETLSQIERDRTEMLQSEIMRVIQDPNIPEQEVPKLIAKYHKWLKYSYRDSREIRTNQLLKHYIKELDLKLKFNEGFKNALIVSEEAYLGDVVNGRPVIEVMNPNNTFVIRSGSSNRFEDADIIFTYDFWSPGQILDRFYKHLTDAQISKLDLYAEEDYKGGDSDQQRDEYSINRARQEYMKDGILTLEDVHGTKFRDITSNSSMRDGYGNIRVIRMFWKSKKKVIRVKSYQEETGDVIYDYFSEGYIANTAKGEETEEYWVTQWWEGVKVGEDLYPYIRPRQIQYNKISDPGYNHPGIVGQIYNVNGYRATSLMERAMPYQLLYDATHHRMIDAMSKFFGSLPVVDKADLPDGWDIDKWLFFARKAGIAVKDSFKEGKKGRATGVLAGGLSGSQNVMNQAGLGDYIQQQINILNFLEQQMGRIIGVSPQRLGDIQNRETVGGVERAVTQSSFVTNELFKIHDNVKKRVLTMLVELCKIAHKDNPVKFQNVSDDLINEIFSIEDEFLDEEYGIILDNDSDLSKLEQKLDGLAQAGLQNQMIKFSDIMKIYTSSSLADIQRTIESSEEQMKEAEQEQLMQQQQAMEQQTQIQQQAIQQQAMDKEREYAFKEREHSDKIALEQFKVNEQELTKRMELDVDRELLMTDQVNNRIKLEADYDKNEKDLIQKMKDLDEKIRNNKANEVIARLTIQQKKEADRQKATQSKTNN